MKYFHTFIFVLFSDPSETDGPVVSETGNPLFLSGHGKPIDPRLAAEAQESMKAKVNAIIRKLVEQVRRICACVCEYMGLCIYGAVYVMIVGGVVLYQLLRLYDQRP